MGVTKTGISILKKKGHIEYIYIQNLRTPGANILKQDALSVGADVAVPKGTICCETHYVDALIMGTPAQLKDISKKASRQDFGLKEVAKFLNKLVYPKNERPKIMGIINANEDSFYKKGRFNGNAAIAKIEQMLDQGASMIDLGGVSSRPGSFYAGEDEELKRVAPIIDEIYAQKLYEKAIFSLDSYSILSLKYALERGFSFINDITGLANEGVAKLAADYNASVCIMHMQGAPNSMQEKPHYEDVISEVDEFFSKQIFKAKSYGVKEIVLDVGIGFGKTLEHNLLLLKHHKHFTHHGFPLLVGASRKSLINNIIKTPIDERLPGTLVLHLEAVKNGANIIRCHDVAEHVQALEVAWALKNSLIQGQ